MSPRPTLRIGSACYKYAGEKKVFMEAKATLINKAGDELVFCRTALPPQDNDFRALRAGSKVIVRSSLVSLAVSVNFLRVFAATDARALRAAGQILKLGTYERNHE